MKIRIPPSLRSALEALAKLTQESFDSYVAVVGDVSATMSQEHFIVALKNNANTSGEADQEPFIDAAFGLHAGYRAASVTAEEFSTDVAKSLSQSNKLADRDQFEARIRALLSVQSLTLASRARGLLLETERHATEFRIVSDIRPVFDKPGTTILGAIVMHSLRISYHEQKGSAALFVSLDSDDLKELSSVARRALEKEKMLNALVADRGLTLIQDNTEDTQEKSTS